MKRFVTIVLLALAVVGAGCSGDSAEETTTTGVAPASTTTVSSTSTEAPPTTDAGDAVNIVNFTFQPGDLSVSAGSAVTFTNGDGPAHTTTSDDDVWDSGVLNSGDSFDVVFDQPGVFDYHCSIHPSMKATVTVEG